MAGTVQEVKAKPRLRTRITSYNVCYTKLLRIQNVVNNATVPVIETGAGICHTYLDATADAAMATDITLNAKVQRPSVCNSMETMIVITSYSIHYTKLYDPPLLDAKIICNSNLIGLFSLI